MHTLEETFSPTPLQEASDDTLRSEQRVGKYLPRVLSRIDLLVVFIAVVVFIPDSAVVQTTQAAGPITYVYWLVGTVTFLVPGAIVVAQLNRFLPVDGSIYVWTHRALGSL
jgi:amino acid transporter